MIVAKTDKTSLKNYARAFHKITCDEEKQAAIDKTVFVFLRIELFLFRAFLALTSKVESVAPRFLNTMSSFWSF